MAKKTKMPDAVATGSGEMAAKGAEDPAAALLDHVEFEADAPAETVPPRAGTEALPESGGEIAPSIFSPEWTPYVLSLLQDNERTKGRPRVSGLRRLLPLLVGDILENTAEVVQAPNPANGYIATVQAKLVVLWHKDVPDGASGPRLFSGLADVYPGNTNPSFARYASSTAETLAEGRAIKKALALQVPTAEEMADVAEETPGEVSITPAQIQFIDVKCKQNNIDVLALIGTGKVKYLRILDVPYDHADKIGKYLSDIQRGAFPLPERLKGYDPDWNKKTAK